MSKQQLRAQAHTLQQYSIARAYVRFTEIKSNFRRKKLHRANKGSKLLAHITFVMETMQEVKSNLEEKDNFSILKDDSFFFFFRSGPIHFQINRRSYQTGQIKQAGYFQHRNQQATSQPSPFCLIGQIQIEKLNLADAIKSDLLYNRKWYHSRRSNITDNFIRKVINVQQKRCRTKNGRLKNSSINWIFLTRLPIQNHLKPPTE